jgi:hypothetical protein
MVTYENLRETKSRSTSCVGDYFEICVPKGTRAILKKKEFIISDELL